MQGSEREAAIEAIVARLPWRNARPPDTYYGLASALEGRLGTESARWLARGFVDNAETLCALTASRLLVVRNGFVRPRAQDWRSSDVTLLRRRDDERIRLTLHVPHDLFRLDLVRSSDAIGIAEALERGEESEPAGITFTPYKDG